MTATIHRIPNYQHEGQPMRSYRDSMAYQRSNGMRPDGSRPRWPLTVEDYPSLPEAHANVAAKAAKRTMERRVSGSRGVR